MRRSVNWVTLAALAALGATPARLPGVMQFDAVAAISPVRDSPLRLSPPVAPQMVSSEAGPAALDEMLRDASGQHQQWPTTPELVVLTSVMKYKTGEAREYVATSELVSAEDTQSLVADLTLALRQLTNDAFVHFATVRYETVPPGSSVNIARPKQIVVGRYKGLHAMAQTLGFGGRSARRDGAITSGAIVLDNEFDRTSELRRLLRTHELGHALGYNHVKSRVSIMNPRIGPELTDFDRQVVMLAFRRPDSRSIE